MKAGISRVFGFFVRSRLKAEWIAIFLSAFLLAIGTLSKAGIGGSAGTLGSSVLGYLSVRLLFLSLGPPFRKVAEAARLWWSEGANHSLDTRIVRPPGSRLRVAMAAIFGKATSSRLFDQVIGDSQDDWLEAQCNNQIWLSRWIRVRLVIEIGMSIFALAWEKIVKNAFAVSKGGK